jgi:HSP20 family protein
MVYLPSRRQNSGLNPFVELENLQREMNRLFDFSFFKGTDEDSSLWKSQWAPAIDVFDSKDSLVIKADLPGLNKDEIDVSIQDNILTIRGEKKQEFKNKENNYLRSERFYGIFHRAIALPAEVDRAKIQASFKDGVLELTLPKSEESKPKQIKIDVK